MEKFDIIVKTYANLENVLADELAAIGGSDVIRLTRAVRCKGDLEVLYKANYLVRTAVRVLKPIATFRIFNDHQLHRKVKRIPWEQYMSVSETFAIDAVTFSPIFRNSRYIALKTKDAIADRFRELQGRRPNVDTDSPDLLVNVHIADKECTISLDSSGQSLDKRGYRIENTEASMSEVLAAGIIALSGWDGQRPFLDPMCGSGTIAIEAALKASGIPPGKYHSFAFEKWRDFDRSIWQTVKDQAEAMTHSNVPEIFASDISGNSVEIARRNARRAGVHALIKFETSSFFDRSGLGDATIVINPPYGERLENTSDLEAFYSEIGTHLKHNFEGSDAWIISSNIKALKRIGLRPSSKTTLHNGKLECRLHGYALYRGSKKTGS